MSHLMARHSRGYGAAAIRLLCLPTAAALAMVLGGCITTSDGPAKAEGPTHYTLETGKVQDNPAPLPDMTPIMVHWHMPDGSVKTVEGFRGWDFDGDHRFEMVEVLDKDDGVQSWVYDFDADGVIDAVRGQQGGVPPLGVHR